VVFVDFLRAKTDIFVWSPSDMPGIPREVAEHSLAILPHFRTVQERLRRFDEDDEETLQERFQLRSRFSRPRLPNVPLVQDPPTSLEASLPAPPRKPRNMARKRVAKKLKVTETTSQEVSFLE
jgi:hypothetical protein